MRARTPWLALVAVAAAFAAAPAAQAAHPPHPPFKQMSLAALVKYQRLVVAQDRHALRWWAQRQHRRLAHAGVALRMPYAVWWDSRQLGWVLPQLRRNAAVLRSRQQSLPLLFWSCVATGWTGGTPGVGVRVSTGEGGATSYDGAGHYGRYQMDWSFMEAHGSDMLAKYHRADATHWSVQDQTVVAERGYLVQGAGAWPNTAPPCMSLR